MGGNVPRRLTRKQLAFLAEREMVITDFSKGVYGKRLEDPILGNYFHMPKRTSHRHEFQLDTSFSYVRMIILIVFLIIINCKSTYNFKKIFLLI